MGPGFRCGPKYACRVRKGFLAHTQGSPFVRALIGKDPVTSEARPCPDILRELERVVFAMARV